MNAIICTYLKMKRTKYEKVDKHIVEEENEEIELTDR